MSTSGTDPDFTGADEGVVKPPDRHPPPVWLGADGVLDAPARCEEPDPAFAVAGACRRERTLGGGQHVGAGEGHMVSYYYHVASVDYFAARRHTVITAMLRCRA